MPFTKVPDLVDFLVIFVATCMPSFITGWMQCVFPDNWNNVNLGWGKSWLQVHASHAKTLGKPLVIEEWGKYAGVPHWPTCICASSTGVLQLLLQHGHTMLQSQCPPKHANRRLLTQEACCVMFSVADCMQAAGTTATTAPRLRRSSNGIE